jgi:predicted dehydrogenase
MRLAFMGFRHGHIMGLYSAAKSHPRVQVVAACEENAATVESLRAGGKVEITHTNYETMLRDVQCDAIAVGDYFAKRGPVTVRALEAGKHVLADKPICTTLAELSRIEELAREKQRVVGCLLDLRESGAFRTMRRLIGEGAIGEVHTVILTAQHPLNYANRPKWYFEDGKHGGTINDIAVHAIDLVPWMTGRKLSSVVAARAWNARLPQHPKFQDAGQFMLKLDNNGSVFGDVSYLSPDGLAYSAPQYWRITVHGTGGMIETKLGSKTLLLAQPADKTPREIPADEDQHNGCLNAFLNEMDGRPAAGDLTSQDVFRASRHALLAQQAADQNQTNVPMEQR